MRATYTLWFVYLFYVRLIMLYYFTPCLFLPTKSFPHPQHVGVVFFFLKFLLNYKHCGFIWCRRFLVAGRVRGCCYYHLWLVFVLEMLSVSLFYCFFCTGSAKRCLLNSACGFNIGERTPRCREWERGAQHINLICRTVNTFTQRWQPRESIETDA